MVARAYDNLGGVRGLGDNPPVPYSSRGNDKDRFQTFIFDCSANEPFSGQVEFQASVNSPTTATTEVSWSTMASLDFYGERDPIFLETQVEATKIRIRCSRYDENVSVSADFGSVITTHSGLVAPAFESAFKIDGIEVDVKVGDTLANIKSLIDIEGIPNIVTSTTKVPNSLIITKSDGTEMTLEETFATPLQDIGIFTHNDAGVVTVSPKGKIKSITGMR